MLQLVVSYLSTVSRCASHASGSVKRIIADYEFPRTVQVVLPVFSEGPPFIIPLLYKKLRISTITQSKSKWLAEESNVHRSLYCCGAFWGGDVRMWQALSGFSRLRSASHSTSRNCRHERSEKIFNRKNTLMKLSGES